MSIVLTTEQREPKRVQTPITDLNIKFIGLYAI